MKKGIKVGLGTDMSGGYSPSILEAVRQATLVSRMVALVDGDETKLSLTEALYLATSGGADVVGLGDKIGAFRVGMEWDAILVGMGNVPEEEEGEEEEEEEPTAELDFNGQTPKVDEDETAKVEDVEMKDRLPPLAHPDSVDKSAPKTGGVDDTEVRKPQIKDGVLDSAVDIFGWENWEEKVAKWVYNGDDRNTVGVWVAGVQVYRKGGIAPTWPLDRSG
jgi:guanine deaminase